MSQLYTLGRLRGKFCIVWYEDGVRRRHSLGTSDAREAERLAPSFFVTLTTKDASTVQALWDAYTADMKGRAVVGTMKHTWKALKDRFGPMHPTEITDLDCRAHTAARRQKGIANGTIHTELGHLRMVLLWAVKRKRIDAAPHIERPPKPKSATPHLTREEVKRLIKAASLPHIKLFIALAVATAARSGALLDLTWGRCDFSRGLIHLENPEIDVPHKGRAVVPMNNLVRNALKEAERGHLSEYVIEWAGGKVGSVKRALATAGRRAGVGKVAPHMLRHTAAVHMAEAGIQMEEIAQYLGHEDVQVTRTIYARFSPTYLRGAASVLEYE